MIAVDGPLDMLARSESWPLAAVFTISRGSKSQAEVVLVELRCGDAVGRGECVPYPRYGETVPQVLAALETCLGVCATGLTTDIIADFPLPLAARNALDCALWDFACKMRNIPAWQLAGLAQPTSMTTAFTISLDTPVAMARAASVAGHPLLKLKLGRDGDKERMYAVRAAVPDARIIVDANEGWSPVALPALLRVARDVGVELVEQPLPAGADDALRDISRDCLICADESAHGIASLPDLVGKYDAINIKLDKTGGLTPALALARAAKEKNLDIMVGCMVATSLAMAPATLIGQFARYIDLDGPLLLQKDRDCGIAFNGGTMQPPQRALWG